MKDTNHTRKVHMCVFQHLVVWLSNTILVVRNRPISRSDLYKKSTHLIKLFRYLFCLKRKPPSISVTLIHEKLLRGRDKFNHEVNFAEQYLAKSCRNIVYRLLIRGAFVRISRHTKFWTYDFGFKLGEPDDIKSILGWQFKKKSKAIHGEVYLDHAVHPLLEI